MARSELAADKTSLHFKRNFYFFTLPLLTPQDSGGLFVFLIVVDLWYLEARMWLFIFSAGGRSFLLVLELEGGLDLSGIYLLLNCDTEH